MRRVACLYVPHTHCTHEHFKIGSHHEIKIHAIHKDIHRLNQSCILFGQQLLFIIIVDSNAKRLKLSRIYVA